MGKCIMPQVIVLGGGEEPLIPEDGKSLFQIRVTAVTGKSLLFTQTKNNTATLTVDWGDGTTSTRSTSGAASLSHTYENFGDYNVTAWISSGTGTYGSAVSFIGGNIQEARDMLLRAYLGNNISTIGYGFQNNYALREVYIPDYLGTIGSSAFESCYGIRTYVILKTDGVVTLPSTSAFGNIVSSAKIYVPDELVASYKTATNWSTYADYIYPLSEKGVTHND